MNAIERLQAVEREMREAVKYDLLGRVVRKWADQIASAIAEMQDQFSEEPRFASATRGKVSIRWQDGEMIDYYPPATPAQGDVPLLTRTAPERIWLQIADDEYGKDSEFPENTEDVTWSSSVCVESEVEYVRADLATGRAVCVPADGVPDDVASAIEAAAKICDEMESYEGEDNPASLCATYIRAMLNGDKT